MYGSKQNKKLVQVATETANEGGGDSTKSSGDGSKHMLQLIGDMLSSDCKIHSEAVDCFEKICTKPATVMTLSKLLIVPDVTVEEREQTACLLRHSLNPASAWRELSDSQQLAIKRATFRALHNARMPAERESLTRCLGVLMRHELANSHDSWLLNIFEYVHENCSCVYAAYNETGSSVFLTLAQAEPAIFVPFFETNLKTFLNVLQNANKCGKFNTPVVINMLEGVAQLVCHSVQCWQHNPQTIGMGELRLIEFLAPLIVKALRAIVAANAPVLEFMRAHLLLEQLAEHAPQLLAHNYRDYMRHAVVIASDETLVDCVRVVNFHLIRRLMGACPMKVVHDRQLLSIIIKLVFSLLARTLQHDVQNELDYVEEELFENIESEVAPELATAAIDVIQEMAVKLPADQFVSHLLETLQPSLASESAEIRRTVHVCLMLIIEEVQTLPRAQTIDGLLQTLQLGITDPVGCVRSAAYTELCYVTASLQPVIFDWTDQVLPLLDKFLQQIEEAVETVNLRLNQTHLIFTTLESFCSKAPVPKLLPFLPQLMTRLFALLNINISDALNVMSLRAISSVCCNIGDENLLPYFDQLMAKLTSFLFKTDDFDLINVRSQAMNTIANIANCFSSEHLQPWADYILDFTVEIALDESKYSDQFVQAACYTLIGALARVVGPRMGEVYPLIMKRLYVLIDDNQVLSESECISTSQGTQLELELEQAIHAVRCFARQTPLEFAPFAMTAFCHVYQLIDHAEDVIRKAVCLTLTGLLIMLNTLQQRPLVKVTHNMLMPKLVRIVREVENVLIVMAALKSLDNIVCALGVDALRQDELADALFQAVLDIINEKAACSSQVSNVDANFNEVTQLYVIAADLLPHIGQALPSKRYERYFPSVVRLLDTLQRDKRFVQQRAHFFDALTRCIAPLGTYCAKHFDDFCAILIRGLEDAERCVRRCSFYGIGELVYHAGVSSNKDKINLGPLLTQRIVDVGETDREILDTYCGAIARIIIVSHHLVPLAELLSVFFDKLPIREILVENSKVIRCLSLLYEEAGAALEPYVQQMIELVVQMLAQQQLCDDRDGIEIALRLLQQLYDTHYDEIKLYVKSHPDTFMFQNNSQIDENLPCA